MQVSEKLLKKCKPANGHVLVLKSLPANMKAYGDFQWPKSGIVSAPDWKPTKECGNGLHGWLWGAGDAGLRCEDDDAKWMVLSVQVDSIVDLEGKVKFPSCLIAYMGDRETAVSIIQHYAPSGTAIMFSTVTGGYRSTVTGGDRSTVTGGEGSTVTGGDRSTVTGGYGSTVTGGYRSTVTGGYRSTVTGGDRSTVRGGYGSTVTGGYGSTVTGGDRSVIIIDFFDSDAHEIRRKIALVDGITIMPNTKYRLNDQREFEVVE